MYEFIKLLDSNLEYLSHEIRSDTVYVEIKSNKTVFKCPHCGVNSSKVHSKYKRTFQDLPIQGKKVIIDINNRKIFCINPDCKHTTFAESFDFIRFKGKKTKRLEKEIVDWALNISSVTASNILSNKIVKVSKSTVCNLLKKRNFYY